MIKKTVTHIKLGIFVTIGFILFAVAIYFISAKQQLFTKTFRVNTIFSDVSGLQVGNNVRFSGITVGVIGSIKMQSDTTVRVDMLISEDAQRFIKKDAVATIGTEGLMGNKIVIITAGTSSQPEIEDNDLIRSNPPVDFDRLMNTIKSTGDNVSLIISDAVDIVRVIRQGKGTIGQLFMDSIYLKQARDNLAQFTGDLAEISGSLRSGRSALGKMLMDSTYMKIPIDNAISLSSDLKDIVQSVHSGKGLLGRMVMDSAAAFTLDTTLVNLKQATNEMKHVIEEARKSFLLWKGF